MKINKKNMCNGFVAPEEFLRTPHIILEGDFSTNYPSQSRINRVACEIDEYLRRKRKYMEG